MGCYACHKGLGLSMQLNLATKITLFRIFMTPLIVALLYFEGPITCFMAAVAFILASLSDWADGYIARRENMVTSLGKFLDPLADKVLICSVLIMLVGLDWIPIWVAIVIVCRELVVTGLRAIAMDEGIVLAADNYGKAKTLLQTIALVPLLVHYPLLGVDIQGFAMVLLYVATALAVYSGYNYVYSFYKGSLSRKA